MNNAIPSTIKQLRPMIWFGGGGLAWSMGNVSQKLHCGLSSRAVLAGGAFLVSGTLAMAQVGQPSVGTQSQVQVDQLNRRIGNQEQARSAAQQQQFEANHTSRH